MYFIVAFVAFVGIAAIYFTYKGKKSGATQGAPEFNPGNFHPVFTPSEPVDPNSAEGKALAESAQGTQSNTGPTP